MIKEIHYKNFKALRDTTLPLGQFTLIVGANGTGKTTAIRALEIVSSPDRYFYENVISVEANEKDIVKVELINFLKHLSVCWDKSKTDASNEATGFYAKEEVIYTNESQEGFDNTVKQGYQENVLEYIKSFRKFNFDSERISQTVPISSDKKLRSDGGNLAGILDLLKDSEPERWIELNKELMRWFPEFDQILFDRNDAGKFIVLRAKNGQHKIPIIDISDGTRLALAYLTLAYLPNPPKIVAFEEPEHGVHPRLLENIQEAMYRLAYPENYGEKRDPVQVIATTHSPYLLDLYKDHPEEIVIASKDEDGVRFERLIEQPHYEEVIKDAPLGEIWYTGVLGGVPVQP